MQPAPFLRRRVRGPALFPLGNAATPSCDDGTLAHWAGLGFFRTSSRCHLIRATAAKMRSHSVHAARASVRSRLLLLLGVSLLGVLAAGALALSKLSSDSHRFARKQLTQSSTATGMPESDANNAASRPAVALLGAAAATASFTGAVGLLWLDRAQRLRCAWWTIAVSRCGEAITGAGGTHMSLTGRTSRTGNGVPHVSGRIRAASNGPIASVLVLSLELLCLSI